MSINGFSLVPPDKHNQNNNSSEQNIIFQLKTQVVSTIGTSKVTSNDETIIEEIIDSSTQTPSTNQPSNNSSTQTPSTNKLEIGSNTQVPSTTETPKEKSNDESTIKENLKKFLEKYLRQGNENNEKIDNVNKMVKEIVEKNKKEEEEKNNKNFEKQVEKELRSFEKKWPTNIDEFVKCCEDITKCFLRKDLNNFKKRYSKDTKNNSELRTEFILKVLEKEYNSIFLYLEESIIIMISDSGKKLRDDEDETIDDFFIQDKTFEVYCVKQSRNRDYQIESIKNTTHESYCYNYEYREFLEICGMFAIDKHSSIRFFDEILDEEKMKDMEFTRYSMDGKKEKYDGKEFEYYRGMRNYNNDKSNQQIKYIVCGNWEKRTVDPNIEKESLFTVAQ